MVSLISTVLISVGYLSYMFQRAQEGGGTTDDGRFWAAVILIFIPVFIVGNVILHIVFSIINTLVTREQEPTITDEFDKLVELKATRNFYHIFMAGFLLSLVTLVAGLPSYVMFLVVIAAVVVAAVMQDISQLFYYRRGV
ncbi:MAG: hypothetical protein SGJ24_03210 [Chloroflexota bacterium]|nr:hypothetical protein [Chloroflexota bacterium]